MVVLALAAALVTLGFFMLIKSPVPEGEIFVTSMYAEADLVTGMEIEMPPAEETAAEEETSEAEGREHTGTIRLVTGILLCAAGAAAAVIGTIGLWPQTPVTGPDAAVLAVSAPVALPYGGPEELRIFLIVYSCLIGIREFCGWIRAKCSLSWCALQRLALAGGTFRRAMLTYLFAAVCAAAVPLWLYQTVPFENILAAAAGWIVFLIFAGACLLRYSADAGHLTEQVGRLGNGEAVEVRAGAFAREEEQLADVKKQQEEAIRTAVTSERFKVELIANVSHDLRTPLTSILGYGELLKEERLSENGREQLERLNRKAGYMNDLVESLFELTKVSSGTIECRMERIDLIRLLEQTIGLLQDELDYAGLQIRRSYPEKQLAIWTDGSRMHQVFSNLLENAMKYALRGTRIYLYVTDGDTMCEVRLVNTASYEMDFTPEEVMQRFVRGDKARTTRGSGLGLAIAQTYTESVGGTFAVEIDGDQFSAAVRLPKNERNL